MLKNADLQISEVRSTILQPPTEEPLYFEFTRKGYYKDAGLARMAGKKFVLF